ncbi:SRPBCC family protein [uncultured Thioclava sp.]|jgi:carbon monoxide dehydrogenase subunit G|uniref:SRPBCC family protein n=1 Tax=uncultured Thioclava sp. TaxID=473858 RepID=UPI0025F6CD52|nr:SRPBCC family protein [uncultured Thioclava sp.]
MKFSTRKDIAAPAEFIFDRLADFSSFERVALRRGITLKRLDTLAIPGAGMSWEIGFRFRGRERQMITDLATFERPEALVYLGTSTSFEARLEMLVTELSKTRTRMQTALEVRPRTLGARLMVQSAKLGKGNLDRRFDERVGHFAQDLERQAEKTARA